MRQDRPQDAGGTGGLDEKSKSRKSNKSLGPASNTGWDQLTIRVWDQLAG